ncbi:hypothetical protein [Streptomyces beijiangensis]|uniref:Lipoprotein n=1 Tax=Streptomyces beijiangensis TaxID=163361 RepID=A0A939FCD4_9ACTN|nr:hypothetical protein [Streptomyces beijiangensis]MBO0516022.1 hypothetical protein [Streptomyces beijiangensis]
MRLHITRPAFAGLYVLSALALTACGSAQNGGAFDSRIDSEQPHCRAHQSHSPGVAYTDPKQRNTLAVLTMLKYYTAKGTQPFCDGKPATRHDTAWNHLHADLTTSTTVRAPAGLHRHN